MNYDVIVVGAGFAGSVIAQKFHADGKKVLVIESRKHIGGNMYDYIDENGVNRHEYGPHIFHTNSQKVVDYLSAFTQWYPYVHRVLGNVNGHIVPIPFNLRSIEDSFDAKKAESLKKVLVDSYGMDKKVPILELRKNSDPNVGELADYIYEHVFKYYTMKQWGLTVEQIDPEVTNRVPVNVSYDDRYFADKYQIMPKEGYTKIFEKMLAGVEVRLATKACDVLQVDVENKKIYFEGSEFKGIVVYTGAVDELLDYRLGDLPYRSLRFDVQSHKGQYQQATTINYPTPQEVNGFTRITEYKLMMESYPEDKTTIAVEYPLAYDRHAKEGNIPYYPIFTEDNQSKYEKYCDLLAGIDNLYLLGRLAEYKYYNMDAIVEKALDLFEMIKTK
ncbi:MAG: UDP-galactopyranose mutase [Erysipelotrichaceae bacterium]|nr:UDP-galactopyranose mutase [Erysipelotrichaceae bacterium]MDY5252411.1 UDP-galactopyranose mutase [Erysipelotrichaceae bacterium]